MITSAAVGPVPTVYLHLRVPVAMPNGGWSWGELPGYEGVLAQEFAYSAQEVRSLIQAYGRVIGQIASPRKVGERFSILAKGPVTGLAVGLRTWVWCPVERQFVADGEYLDGFRAAARAYWEATGTLITRQHFSAIGHHGPMPKLPTQRTGEPDLAA